MKHVMSRLKFTISITFSFLLTLLFFMLIINVGLSFGVFSNKSIISKLNETHYYEHVYTKLNENVQGLVLKAGIPVSVLEGVITQERIYIACNNYINKTLLGEIPQISTDRLRSELEVNIIRYIEEQGIEQSDEVLSVINKVINLIEKEYENDVQLLFINSIMEFRNQYIKVIAKLYPIVIILIACLTFCLLKLYRHKHRGLRYINYAIISASLLLILLSSYIILNRRYERLNVMPLYYRDFLTAYFGNSIQACLYIGLLGLIISAALISLTGYIKNGYKKK